MLVALYMVEVGMVAFLAPVIEEVIYMLRRQKLRAVDLLSSLLTPLLASLKTRRKTFARVHNDRPDPAPPRCMQSPRHSILPDGPWLRDKLRPSFLSVVV